MGAIFSIPLARIEKIADLEGEVVGLAPDAPLVLRGPASGGVSLVIGAEREGLPAEVLAACGRVCRIEQVAGESLNAAMAATVALYEVTRMAAQ
jgi:TrmH family RNA methyltransferase